MFENVQKLSFKIQIHFESLHSSHQKLENSFLFPFSFHPMRIWQPTKEPSLFSILILQQMFGPLSLVNQFGPTERL
jgi:hypothetical protein